MSRRDPAADPIDALAARYRDVAAPAGFADRVAARAEPPRVLLPRVTAALAAAALAAVALLLTLPVMDGAGDGRSDPRWRVSATTPARPDVRPQPVAPLRVTLSLKSPPRPDRDAATPDDTPPPG